MEKLNKTLISFGEILYDVFSDSSEIGGAPLNFSSWFSALGNDSYMLSSVGNDTLGDKTFEILSERKVLYDLVTRNALPTGSCLVTLDESRIPSYELLTNVAYDEISADIEKLKALSANAFYFGTLAQRSQNNRRLLENILLSVSFDEVFCDVNIRKGCYDPSSVLFCLEHATILKFSDDDLEESAIAKAVGCECSKLLEKIASKYPNIRLILRTLGQNGSEIFETPSGRMIRIPAVSNPHPISTVGAGDSYGAAFLSAYLDGRPIEECGILASETSSYVVGLRGAI